MTPDRSPSARDLAAEMAALADLLDLPTTTPWPVLTRAAIEQLKGEEEE